METTSTLRIEKRNASKIGDVDFSNLAFGSVFTDHMFSIEYANGAWQQPEIVPYGPIPMEPSAKVFHYGQAVFEGMKAFKDDNGDVFLFRPEDNWARINKSSARLAMPELPKDIFMEGLTELLKLDEAWIKAGDGNSLYIRPFNIATQSGVSASPADRYKFLIILAPAQSYYSGEVSVVFAEKYSRAASGGVGFAKAAGNYAAQFYPTNLAKEEGYQQIIWTDANTHEYLEEAGTMNVFFRVGDTLLTAPTNDTILDGITRKSVIQLAKDAGITVEVRPVAVKEIVAASEAGDLKEIFGVGTAAVVVPFKSFAYKGEDHKLNAPENSYGMKFKKALNDIQYNRSEDKYGWRVAVK
ncbi:branched-chain amino acid aminotransferase [Dokdonia sp. Hel_I_63]|jgi:branched-chain amino acid aminotransferase|uniref:branched-chain amino acid aminotransferase n=1 Tax=unclassified Dokdonia TaxID=2615033 RepID=UPI00020A76AA|nr:MULTISPECIES: branched-chain amino acid aminotransferase [unclassified Dokdonia]AEE18704.1 branched-chain amino acid aminotransferase [Dokdonia sp. 4H-3-7-5]TVZ22067.1 branched-chain amino acid aminotransferase [Dokdonia sp. Hel_I_63]